ncbi:hypothetical protein CONLIGDRAFT_681677 [Coniochaeta ligniaria NRRL 30616]|uniref:Uncharacterized protein n=1 Tax=Coniochaeta ligniaria NRRL 30616 TaxID=1408157 RepID=A0A1J7JM02_9PEZI|nr:hypothetical protein CONLIGDRAFT_681677 [Coniochaeta ligniaria NRRL 30616]
MARGIWTWAHTATFLAHSAYMVASAVAFVVSSHKSLGNFEDRNDQCNSSCAIKAWGSSALAMCAGVVSLLLFAATRRWDKSGPMTPERFDGSSFVIKIGWGIHPLLAWAEYYLSASISQHLAGCSIMRAPFLLGIAALLSQLVVVYADYAKWVSDREALDEVLAPDLPHQDPETPTTPALGIPIPVWSSRFTDRLVEV